MDIPPTLYPTVTNTLTEATQGIHTWVTGIVNDIRFIFYTILAVVGFYVLVVMPVLIIRSCMRRVERLLDRLQIQNHQTKH